MPRGLGELQRFLPAPRASWSLLRSLLFRGAVKRIRLETVNVLELVDLEVVSSSSEVIRDPARNRTASGRSAATLRSLQLAPHPNPGPYLASLYRGPHFSVRPAGNDGFTIAFRVA